MECMAWLVNTSQHKLIISPAVWDWVTSCKQLTKTLGSKRPAVDWLIVAYCSSVNFAIINATMSLYRITYSFVYAHSLITAIHYIIARTHSPTDTICLHTQYRCILVFKHYSNYWGKSCLTYSISTWGSDCKKLCDLTLHPYTPHPPQTRPVRWQLAILL